MAGVTLPPARPGGKVAALRSCGRVRLPRARAALQIPPPLPARTCARACGCVPRPCAQTTTPLPPARAGLLPPSAPHSAGQWYVASRRPCALRSQPRVGKGAPSPEHMATEQAAGAEGRQGTLARPRRSRRHDRLGSLEASPSLLLILVRAITLASGGRMDRTPARNRGGRAARTRARARCSRGNRWRYLCVTQRPKRSSPLKRCSNAAPRALPHEKRTGVASTDDRAHPDQRLIRAARRPCLPLPPAAAAPGAQAAAAADAARRAPAAAPPPPPPSLYHLRP